ncbi:MAG: hypothetical protein PQJ50_01815 [Spirochaetales bacterium]|nr:hypothetical protein [Spirochaetales bacterium]
MRFTALFLLLVFCHSLNAQEFNGPYKDEELPYQDVDFPDWVYDVRRFEVIMFGSFPITYIMSSAGFGLAELARSNGSSEFSVFGESDSDNLKYVLLTAAGLSVGVALADLIIGKIKKNRASERDSE